MNKRKIIFILLIVIALIGISLSVTYSLNVLVTENTTSDYDLSYTFDISDNATWTINVEANKTKVYDISITNPYNDSIKYGVIYKLNNPTSMPDGSLVGVLNTSKYPTQDLIEKNNTREVSIAIVNNSDSNMQITLSIVNGYKNGGELIIPEGYTLVTEEYSVVPESLKTLTRLGLTANDTVLTTFTDTSKNDGTTGIYKSEDDLGTSYYFRGNVTNNYVYFAGYYWRIIRINGDGTVRMIYDGTSAHVNSEASTDRQMGKSVFNEHSDDNAYVGYMYGTPGSSTYEATHANTNDSTIKTFLDNWYNTNIKNTKYEQYIADAIYCNDRTLVTDGTKMRDISSYINNNISTLFEQLPTGEGYGTKATLYGFLNRFDLSSVTPSLKCEQVNDRFTKGTAINKVKGNGKLTNPIGLITLDEMVYGGAYIVDLSTFGLSTAGNNEMYLYNGDNFYYALSPLGVDSYEYVLASDGVKGMVDVGNQYNCDTGGVRGVITLTADALGEGTGTMDDPFKTLPSAETTLTNLGLTVNTGTPDFSKTSADDGTTGIYTAEDEFGTSYYFRGNVINNYVYFAGYYWRIIRINGDGSIRMIYDGTSAHANGEKSDDRQIGTSRFGISSDDTAYVGYMYGKANSTTYEETHANTNDSTMKTYLDNWYNANIKNTTYEQYISDAIYCNDREVYTGSGYQYYDTEYYAYKRLITLKEPSLKCNQLNDRFTVNANLNGVTGNGKLTNPIGLITADEVSYAGSIYGGNNNSIFDFYLDIDSDFWTISPFMYKSGAFMFHVLAGGSMRQVSTYKIGDGVRPVISIASKSIKYGNGTSTNPFRINSIM